MVADRVLYFALATVLLSLYCVGTIQAQGTCYVANCKEDNYTKCTETITTFATCNSLYCVKGSTYSPTTGLTWIKKCQDTSDATVPVTCSGFTTSSFRCSSHTVNGATQSYCFSCCVGPLCNRGTPLRASSATALTALGPITLIGWSLFAKLF
eukprot:scpid87085/ scgid34994/ 